MIGQKLVLTFAIGLLATLVTTVLMLLGTLMDLSPMPNPAPAAIVGKVFGQSIPQTSRVLLGFVGHFVYGGIWAILLWHLARPVTIFKGFSLGIILWMIMQLGVLPFLGWACSVAQLPPKSRLQRSCFTSSTAVSWACLGN